MRAALLPMSWLFAGCMAVAGVEDDPLDDPADVVADVDADEVEGPPAIDPPVIEASEAPVAVSASTSPRATRRPEDPWAIHRREHMAELAAMGRLPAEPTTRRERRRAIKEERVLERACRDGQQRADAEIRAGELGHLGFGLPSDCWYVAHERAKRELGIRLGGMGCVIDDESDAMASCYNIVMEREIEARGLDDDLERIFAQACGD
jgi:hypothetical protein